MIEWIIRRSVANRFLVLMGALFLSIWGTWTIINTPVLIHLKYEKNREDIGLFGIWRD
nr:hypothetical protein [Escherichia coli]